MKRVAAAAGFMAIIAFCGSGFAQGTAAAANNGGAEASSDVGKFSNMDQLMNHQAGSMRFYGKVSVDGVRALWDPIPIIVTCDGKVRYNTTADANGGFNIEAAQRQSEIVTQKADLSHVTPAALVGCAVSARLEGFKSTSLNIANRSLTDDPSLGTISLTPDSTAGGSVVSATTSSAPADAIKYFEKAHAELAAKHSDAGRKDLQKAVAIDPQFAEAWYHLGVIEETDKPDDAMSAFDKAVAADPRFVPSYQHIAAIAANRKDWKSVVSATSKSLELNPAGSPEVWYFDAVGKLNSGDSSDAETSAQNALAMDPNHQAPKTEQLLAVIEAGHGEYKDALEHLRNCLTYTAPGPDAELMKKQIAQLETVESGQSH